MSKGFGKLQRLILSELEKRDRFNLQELLGSKYTKAQYNALNRAMMGLEGTGMIKVHRFAFGGGFSAGRTYVHRIGTIFLSGDRQKYEDQFKCW